MLLLLLFFFLLFFAFIFLWHLFLGHVYILQFLLGYLFLLCNLPFQFRNNLFFFSEDCLQVAGRAHVRVDLTISSISPELPLGGLVHKDVLNDQRVYTEALKVSITLCIFEHVQ